MGIGAPGPAFTKPALIGKELLNERGCISCFLISIVECYTYISLKFKIGLSFPKELSILEI